jgi:hypothetical protein
VIRACDAEQCRAQLPPSLASGPGDSIRKRSAVLRNVILDGAAAARRGQRAHAAE